MEWSFFPLSPQARICHPRPDARAGREEKKGGENRQEPPFLASQEYFCGWEGKHLTYAARPPPGPSFLGLPRGQNWQSCSALLRMASEPAQSAYGSRRSELGASRPPALGRDSVWGEENLGSLPASQSRQLSDRCPRIGPARPFRS